MSYTNSGNQSILFKYNTPLDSVDLGQMFSSIVDPGIYSGGIMSQASATLLDIAPFTAMIKSYVDTINYTQNVFVQVTTSAPSALDFTGATTGNYYVYVMYGYKSVDGWYADILYDSSLTTIAGKNGVIIGSVTYTSGGSGFSNISYAAQTAGTKSKVNTFFSNLQVIANPAGTVDTVVVQPGNIVGVDVQKTWSTQTIITLTNNYNVIFIDPSSLNAGTNGIQVASSASLPYPTYINMIPLAEINYTYSGGGHTTVYQSNITDLRPFIQPVSSTSTLLTRGYVESSAKTVSVDFNTLTSTGFYVNASLATNSPDTSNGINRTKSYAMVNSDSTGGYIQQIVINSYNNKIYNRNKYSGLYWTPWNEILISSNPRFKEYTDAFKIWLVQDYSKLYTPQSRTLTLSVTPGIVYGTDKFLFASSGSSLVAYKFNDQSTNYPQTIATYSRTIQNMGGYNGTYVFSVEYNSNDNNFTVHRTYESGLGFTSAGTLTDSGQTFTYSLSTQGAYSIGNNKVYTYPTQTVCFGFLSKQTTYTPNIFTYLGTQGGNDADATWTTPGTTVVTDISNGGALSSTAQDITLGNLVYIPVGGIGTGGTNVYGTLYKNDLSNAYLFSMSHANTGFSVITGGSGTTRIFGEIVTDGKYLYAFQSLDSLGNAFLVKMNASGTVISTSGTFQLTGSFTAWHILGYDGKYIFVTNATTISKLDTELNSVASASFLAITVTGMFRIGNEYFAYANGNANVYKIVSF